MVVVYRQHVDKMLAAVIEDGGAPRSARRCKAVLRNAGRPQSGFHVALRSKKLLALAGLPQLRYHDLRHSAASLIAAQDVPQRVTMEIPGHAQISTTMNINSHLAPEFQKFAVERLAMTLWPES